MKKFLILLFSLLATQNLLASFDTDSILNALDYVVERRDTYYVHHKWYIDSIRKTLSDIPADEYGQRADKYHELFSMYKAYQNDSAQSYATRELDMALRTGSPELILRARTDELFGYLAAGNFSDAVDVVRHADLSDVSPEAKGSFYFLCIRLFSDMSNYIDGTFTDKNAARSRAYSDSVMTIMPPNSYEARYASIFATLNELTNLEKIALYSKILNDPAVPSGEKAMISSMLGDVYCAINDDNGYLYYKAYSGLLDIKEAKRETTALRDLAKFLIEHGDSKRAYNYINVALQDATFYNAPHRKAEISNILPIIESVRYHNVDRSRNFFIWLLIAVSLLAIALLWTLLIIKKANRLIRTQRRELQEAIDKLNESTRIKEEYIGYGFSLNSQLLDKMENLYKTVNLKLKVRQYADLATTFSLSDLRVERERALAEFDKVFLKLFPTFPQKYAALFPEGETLPKAGELTPEMRIFALIRLGVNDISSIANFLHYSTNTVNTYKTRAKNRSNIDNDRFEAAILAIS